ncbi:DUF4411 family protein [Cronobacter turicensis]|nr:DUF4411 family protein [Cronobacter turicensis]ELY4131561.1 DUF4411 family protein [Cronobacter turicensis]ELY4349450.1 DUF4411 family protein [Cronobacter turicensis]ELY6277936.1 DUF4411 family protein [Cronobacter turicensis]
MNNKLFLVDANVLINAHTLYYPLGRVPEFWDWVLYNAKNNFLKIPSEIIEEIQGGESDQHALWTHEKANKRCLTLNESFNVAHLTKIIEEGYAPDLNEIELETIGKDPFLISYAMADIKNRVVVTNEISKPSKRRQNRKVPDVCDHFNIKWCNVYDLLRELDFTTNWKSRVNP